jgi:Holliday junction resolvase
MERRITEEQVTKAILSWLEANGWEIICFDFPQSGTGVSLHPNQELRTTKNKGAIIPDIVAIKNGVVLFFENKDRFVLTDYIKVQELKQTTDYTASIVKFLADFNYSKIFYGVGLAYTDKTEQKTNEHLEKIDFAIFSLKDNSIKITYDPNRVFI